MNESQKKVIEKIKELEDNRSDWFVHEKTLQYLMKICKEKVVLEIGAHLGYSALSISLVANKVVTIEKDKVWKDRAEKNCNLAPNVNIHIGNAIEVLPTLKDKFDIIFVDAYKPEYANYLELSLPLLKDGGIILFDNTVSHKKKLHAFFDHLKKNSYSFVELGFGDGLLKITL